MRRPIAKKYCEGKMKKSHLESEIVKIQESKVTKSHPYCNTDQGDFHNSEVIDNKSRAERNQKVVVVRPERW
jgi:hypothetical protein